MKTSRASWQRGPASRFRECSKASARIDQNEERLQQRVIGQREAPMPFQCRGRSRSGLQDPIGPLALLFFSDRRCGQTETARRSRIFVR